MGSFHALHFNKQSIMKCFFCILNDIPRVTVFSSILALWKGLEESFQACAKQLSEGSIMMTASLT